MATVEEVKVKFTAQIDEFKKNIESAKNTLKGTSDSMDGLSNDIKRASASMDKNMQKIGKSLESEKKKFESASKASKQHANALSEVNAKYSQAGAKLQGLENLITSQEARVNSMNGMYERLSNVMNELKINGSIDDELASMQAHLDQNEQKAFELSNAMRELSETNMKTGLFDGQLMDMNQMQSAMKRLDNDTISTSNKMDMLENATKGVDASITKLGSEQALSKLSGQIATQESKLSSLRNTYSTTGQTVNQLAGRQEALRAKMEQSKSAIASTGARIKQLRASLGNLSSATRGEFMANLTAKIHNAGGAMMSLIHRFKNGALVVGKFATTLGKVGMTAGKAVLKMTGISGAVNRIKSKLSGLSQNLRMMKSIVASMLLMQLFSVMSEGFGKLAQQSSSFNASFSKIYSSFAYLKNSIISAFSPIVSYVQPLLSSLVNSVANAFNKIGEIIAKLTGQKSYTKAVYVAKDYASSLDDTAGSASNASDATDDATKSAEKYNKTIAGFDEITKLDSQDSGSSGGSGGSGGSGSGGGAGSGGGEWVEETVNLDSDLMNAIENGDWESVGALLGEKLNGALESIPWDKIQNAAKNIATNIANFLNGFIETVDWNLVGNTLAQGINTAFIFLNSFVSTFNFKQFGEAIRDFLNSAVKNTNFGLIGTTLGKSIQGAIDTIYEVITGFDYKKLASQLAKFLNNALSEIDLGKAAKGLGKAVIGLLDGIGQFFKDVNWKHVGEMLVDAVTSVDWIGLITSALKAVFAVAGAFIDLVSGIVSGIVNAVANTDWSQVAKDMKNMILNAWKGFGEITVDVWVELKKAWKSVYEWVKDRIENHSVEENVDLVKDWASVFEWVLSFIKNPAITMEVLLSGANWKTVTDWVKEKLGIGSLDIGIGLKKLNWSTLARFVGEIGTKKFGLGKINWSTIAKFIGEIGTKKFSLGKSGWTTISKFIGDPGKIKISLQKGWSNLKSFLGFDQLFKLKLSLPRVGVTVKYGGFGSFRIPYPSFYTYAKGGFPDQGQMFIANEDGPEMVGTMNGNSTVANNQQIVQGIKAGVYQAVTSAFASVGNNNNQPQQVKVYVGGKEVTDYVVKDVNNRTISTGKCPILT